MTISSMCILHVTFEKDIASMMQKANKILRFLKSDRVRQVQKEQVKPVYTQILTDSMHVHGGEYCVLPGYQCASTRRNICSAMVGRKNVTRKKGWSTSNAVPQRKPLPGVVRSMHRHIYQRLLRMGSPLPPDHPPRPPPPPRPPRPRPPPQRPPPPPPPP